MTTYKKKKGLLLPLLKAILVIIVIAFTLTAFSQVTLRHVENMSAQENIVVIVNQTGIYYKIPEYQGSILGMWVSRGMHCDSVSSANAADFVLIEQEVTDLKIAIDERTNQLELAKDEIVVVKAAHAATHMKNIILEDDLEEAEKELEACKLELEETQRKLNNNRLQKVGLFTIIGLGTLLILTD